MSEKHTIMVVDDEPGLRELLRNALTKSGYDVVEAPNGLSALETFDTEAPALVLLDVMMPDLNGFEVLEAIRGRDDTTPIIMCTAMGNAEDVVRALRTGATDYITKPYKIKDLLERIAKNMPKEEALASLDSYTIIGNLGKGGVGEVYEGLEEITGRRVALKVLSKHLIADPEFTARFLREAKLMSAIDHPNIIRIHAAKKHKKGFFIAMELVEGGLDLYKLAAGKRLKIEHAIAIGEGVAAGLKEIASLGIVHRDIKPENILITNEGVPKIADFGIAKEMDSTEGITQQGYGVGTLEYMSPEQLLGKPEPASDLYSFGCTLYFLLVGKPPFSANVPIRELSHQKFQRPPDVRDVRAEVPATVAEMLLRLMAPDAKVRPSFEECEVELGRLSETLAGRTR